MIELEFRSRFSLEEYERLKMFLDAHAECLGEDDKHCVYFILPDRLLKVVRNISKGDAKVSLKLNVLGKDAAAKEVEFYFSEREFGLARELFENLPMNAEVMEDSQQRVNYLY